MASEMQSSNNILTLETKAYGFSEEVLSKNSHILGDFFTKTCRKASQNKTKGQML
jgi:hypothetical protein